MGHGARSRRLKHTCRDLGVHTNAGDIETRSPGFECVGVHTNVV